VKALVTKLMSNRKYENTKKDYYHLNVGRKVIDYFKNIYENDYING
jgi:hypothetical protein